MINNGATRAAARLAEHRAKWDNVPNTERFTRQRVRAMMRKMKKVMPQLARLQQETDDV